ncbi:DUF4232 domain-containing protein [Arthrobacter sp. D1-17]
MRLQRIPTGLTSASATGALVLLLTACGAGGQAGPQPTTSTASETSPSASPADPATPVPPSAWSSASASADPAPAETPSQAPASTGPPPHEATGTAVARCRASALEASTNASGGGAAGSVYMQLILTNSGSVPCHLNGFAGVSLTNGRAGEPIGAPARRDTSTPAVNVLLAPGRAGSAVLRYTQARNHSDCVLVPAAGFRIYPPEETASLFVAQPSDACSNASIELLAIGPFQAQ